jgi:hypothetical protein
MGRLKGFLRYVMVTLASVSERYIVREALSVFVSVLSAQPGSGPPFLSNDQ